MNRVDEFDRTGEPASDEEIEEAHAWCRIHSPPLAADMDKLRAKYDKSQFDHLFRTVVDDMRRFQAGRIPRYTPINGSAYEAAVQRVVEAKWDDSDYQLRLACGHRIECSEDFLKGMIFCLECYRVLSEPAAAAKPGSNLAADAGPGHPRAASKPDSGRC